MGRSGVPLALSVLVLAGAGCEAPSGADDARYSPRPCPAGEALGPSETFDAKELVNEKVGDAAGYARRFGCVVRVAVRDGRALHRDRPRPRVVDVEVRNGYVFRVVAVGETSAQ